MTYFIPVLLDRRTLCALVTLSHIAVDYQITRLHKGMNMEINMEILNLRGLIGTKKFNSDLQTWMQV